MLTSIYKSIIDSLDNYIVVIEENGSITVANNTWLELIAELSAEKDVLVNGTNYFEDFPLLQQSNCDFIDHYKGYISSLFSDNEQKFNIEFPLASLSDQVWLSVSASLIKFEDQKLVILNHSNVIERKKTVVQIDKLTLIDPITKLANRKSFNIFFENEWHRAKRDKKTLTLLIGELEKTALVAEDQQQIADIFAQFARRASDFSAILKNNQFAILLGELKAGDCLKTADKISQEVESLKLVTQTGQSVRINIGISNATPTLIDTSDALINAVFLALEHAKEATDSNVTSYCPTIIYKDQSLIKKEHD
jgi:diguanylate cyclase (GGDEF)-like protein